jgi:hypothetical protein
MKQGHCVVVRACSWLSGRFGTLIIGLIAVGMASVPRPAWAQWNGTNPVWTNSNVRDRDEQPRLCLGCSRNQRRCISRNE